MGIFFPLNDPVILLASDLRCPHCGHVEAMTMPTDACVFFHRCASCDALLRPREGDCCVFCSFGTVVCPPMQDDGGCCAPAVRNASTGASR